MKYPYFIGQTNSSDNFIIYMGSNDSIIQTTYTSDKRGLSWGS